MWTESAAMGVPCLVAHPVRWVVRYLKVYLGVSGSKSGMGGVGRDDG